MSSLRDYEVTFIVRADLDEESHKQMQQKLATVLTHGEGEEAAPVYHAWGKRQLAYSIKKVNEGFYMHYEAQLDPLKISGIERNLNYDDNVLRYLFVRKAA